MNRQEYNDYEARVKAFCVREGVEMLDFESEDHNTSFSHRPCDVCKRALGGNRYDMTDGVDKYEVCDDCVYYLAYGQLDDMTMIEVACDDVRIAAVDADRIRQITHAYIECALWSSTDQSDDSGGEPLDRNYSTADIPREDKNKMQSDCAKFYEKHKADCEAFAEAVDTLIRRDGWEEVGHCFWLSRNGHGAGFFDRFDHRDPDEARALGDRLQAAARAFGEAHLMVGDDGGLYYFTG